MDQFAPGAPLNRLRTAAFTPIGDEGRVDMAVGRLVQAISVGAFVEGERLPSESDLAERLGVAMVTVREALAELRYRGFIETRRGRNGGSFVRSSPEVVEETNVRTLIREPRVAIADLGVHYEVVAAACAEYAARRATLEELDIVEGMLEGAADLPGFQWRRRVTEVHLELAALSQSVRLTSEHLRLQTEFTPLLALQDFDEAARRSTHASLAAQIHATRAGDAQGAGEAVRESVHRSVRWLIAFRAEMLAASTIGALRVTLNARRWRQGGENAQ